MDHRGDWIACHLDGNEVNITPTQIQRAYEFLSTLPPFHKWHLPASAGIIFKTTRSSMVFGTFDVDPPVITISTVMCKNMQDVLETLAHEMAHLKLERKGASSHAEHDDEFKLLAKEVCDVWGWKESKF